MNLLEQLKLNPFVLAPMAGITDHAFRSFMKELGASVVVSELVSANGLTFGNERTKRLLSFDEAQRPVGLQLFGEDPLALAEAAKMVEAMGPDFIDLNFGCPVPKVVKKGGGSALLKDLPALKTVLRSVKSAVNLPVTIKIRTGWAEDSRNADEVCQLAADEGITWVAIHGRTRAQGYSGQSDWDYIAEVKSKSSLPVLGNGDIHTAEGALQRLKESACDGVLIGRGALKNPSIFRECLALRDGKPLPERDFLWAFEQLKLTLELTCEPRVVLLQLKKFASWFSTGFPGASQFRKNLFQTPTLDEMMPLALTYYKNLNPFHQEDTSREAFLMGGHG